MEFVKDNLLAEGLHVFGSLGQSLAHQLIEEIICNMVIDLPHLLVCSVVDCLQIPLVLLSIKLNAVKDIILELNSPPSRRFLFVGVFNRCRNLLRLMRWCKLDWERILLREGIAVANLRLVYKLMYILIKVEAYRCWLDSLTCFSTLDLLEGRISPLQRYICFLCLIVCQIF